MSFEYEDDIDLTSWEVAMKLALRRAKHFQQKQYVWAYGSKRAGVAWTVTDEPPLGSFYDE